MNTRPLVHDGPDLASLALYLLWFALRAHDDRLDGWKP